MSTSTRTSITSCSGRCALDPGPTGWPLQIHAQGSDTGFGQYEYVQSGIVEHLTAIMPEFGLSLFQQPTGVDRRAAWAGPQGNAAWLVMGKDTRERVPMA